MDDTKDKIVTFLIAKRGVKRNGDTDFFDTFDGAVNFKNNANVVVLEDTNALKLVLSNFPDNHEFRLLVHADIGEAGKEIQTKKLKTVVSDIRSIPGCIHINPYFVTRSGEIERLCIKQNKSFIKLKQSEIMCSHTSKLSDTNFLKELKPFSKKTSVNNINDLDKPKIFIGSSGQGIEYANAVKSFFDDHDKHFEATVWVDKFKKTTKHTLTTLEETIKEYKYSIFIFYPDDTITLNRKRRKITRDNVLFEYGLFMGKNTSHQTFYLKPKEDKELHILTDISGLQWRFYTSEIDKGSAVRTACNEILEIIKKAEKII